MFLTRINNRLELKSRQVTVVNDRLRDRQVIPDVGRFDARQRAGLNHLVRMTLAQLYCNRELVVKATLYGRHVRIDQSTRLIIRVKQNVDGCLSVWTSNLFCFNSYVIVILYYIGMCVFHESQRDICHRRAYSQGFAKAVHMSKDRQHFDPA